MENSGDDPMADGSINRYFSKMNGCKGVFDRQEFAADKAQKGIAFASQFLVPLAISHMLYSVLRRYAQSFFAAEILAVMVISLFAPLLIILTSYDGSANAVVVRGSIIMGFNMGLDMHFSSFWTTDVDAVIVATSTTFTTFLLSFATAYIVFDHKMKSSPAFTFEAILFGFIMANVSSPVLARMSTDLKLIKTGVGRLAVSSGHLIDLFTLLFAGMTVGFAYTALSELQSPLGSIVFMVILLAIRQVVFRKLVHWINKKNPEGMRMKAGHLILVVVIALPCVLLGEAVGVNGTFAAFLVALCIPKEGRLVRELKAKASFVTHSIFFPVIFYRLGLQMKLHALFSWKEFGALATFLMIPTAGKLIGAAISASFLGIPLDEAAVLAFLLNLKGYVHVFALSYCLEFLSSTTLLVPFLVCILINVMVAPLVVVMVVKKARHMAPLSQMGLQWMDPHSELRVLACVNNTRHVPTMVNLIEALRGPSESSILVYAMHLVALPDDTNTVLVYQQDQRYVEVVTSIEDQNEQNQISATFRTYEQSAGEGLVLRHMTAVSSTMTMHEDVCNAAEDIRCAIVLLPFHRHQRVDGRMDLGDLGFQSVNRKVLEHAPCTVAVLVDRGLGGTSLLSATQVFCHVAALFVGGPDDREALTLAARMAEHRGVSLTVFRFLPDTTIGGSTRRSSIAEMAPMNNSEAEADALADEEFLQTFRERYVANGTIEYVEKYVANGADTVTRLGELESSYTLFVVGRGGHSDSLVTSGIREWEETPELGPLGDVLASSEFSANASVLIVQQHKIGGGLDDDFV